MFLFCTSAVNAQKINKSNFGAWINCELYYSLKSNQPFDSTSKIIPRFLYFNNLKSIEIESRFEQKNQYKIRQVKSNMLVTDRSKICFKADTLILKDKYWGVIKFVKYK